VFWPELNGGFGGFSSLKTNFSQNDQTFYHEVMLGVRKSAKPVSQI
jgi:hypothetical protein